MKDGVTPTDTTVAMMKHYMEKALKWRQPYVMVYVPSGVTEERAVIDATRVAGARCLCDRRTLQRTGAGLPVMIQLKWGC